MYCLYLDNVVMRLLYCI